MPNDKIALFQNVHRRDNDFRANPKRSGQGASRLETRLRSQHPRQNVALNRIGDITAPSRKIANIISR